MVTPSQIAGAIPCPGIRAFGRRRVRRLSGPASPCNMVPPDLMEKTVWKDRADERAGSLMAEMGETVRLVELVCARLCHDLGGLIGTVGNAVDMVAEDIGGDSEVAAFASSAAKALAQRLRLMRTAWGPES